MARPLVSDELWELIEPLIPKVARRHRFPGRKRLDDRKVLTGILFVLQTGIPWEYLPQEMGCGSGVTCWRRLRDWHAAGVWQRLHETLLGEMRRAGQLEMAAVVADASYLRAFLGAPIPAPALWTAVKPARNTTPWSTPPRAHRWSPRSPRPTRMTVSS